MSPLKFVTISELKSDAKKILTDVQRTGKQVVVTLNGKPVCVIGPAQEESFDFQPEPKKKK